MRKSNSGFTLIELIIAVVIVGILATIAMPSYMQHIRKGKRTDAKTALMGLLQSQERFRSNCSQYAASLGAADTCEGGDFVLAVPATSEAQLYRIALTQATATSFTATATAVTGKAQAADTGCTVLTLAQSNGTVVTTPAACW